MIIAGNDLMWLGPELLHPFDQSLVNPASIDIRMGTTYKTELSNVAKVPNETDAMCLRPMGRILVATFERLTVPNKYAVELRLKSSRAREGWNHALAFWFDPGWDGVGTMELMNTNEFTPLMFYVGMPIAQIIVHELSCPVDKVYSGKYQGATSVEGVKYEAGD